MVKKSAVILGVLAILTIGVGMSWGYTVTQKSDRSHVVL